MRKEVIMSDEAGVPKIATLSGFIDESSKATAIDITKLSQGDRIKVVTNNSIYELEVLDPLDHKINVQGSGDFFLQVTEAYLSGSSMGSALLKQYWITLDWRMEINHNGKTIITSPVREVFVNDKPILRSSSTEVN